MERVATRRKKLENTERRARKSDKAIAESESKRKKAVEYLERLKRDLEDATLKVKERVDEIKERKKKR